MMIPKLKPWKCKAYRDWVKSLPCVYSGIPADDPHHITGLGGKMGSKNSDITCIPLTREAHTKLHNGEIEIDEQYHMNKTVMLASDLGLIEFKNET